MALAIHRLPYGLRDVKVATLDNTGTKGTLVDLPAAQTLEFTEETTSQTLRGDDSVIAQRVTIDSVSWTLESGDPVHAARTLELSRRAAGLLASAGT